NLSRTEPSLSRIVALPWSPSVRNPIQIFPSSGLAARNTPRRSINGAARTTCPFGPIRLTRRSWKILLTTKKIKISRLHLLRRVVHTRRKFPRT
ncbi:unnamed protein product, partial [Aphanomyces euteiches]